MDSEAVAALKDCCFIQEAVILQNFTSKTFGSLAMKRSYFSVFLDENVCFESFKELTEADLLTLIPTIGDRKNL